MNPFMLAGLVFFAVGCLQKAEADKSKSKVAPPKEPVKEPVKTAPKPAKTKPQRQHVVLEHKVQSQGTPAKSGGEGKPKGGTGDDTHSQGKDG